ncbi:MAG: hypothetical protein Q8P36_01495 [bacterium]|nr:hypothetical protein [bacterium]
MSDDFPTARQTGSGIVRYGTMIVLGVFALAIVVIGLRLVMAPMNMVTGVVERVINPEHALQTYRWFHESYQQVQAKKGQIMLAKNALEASAVDRKEARRVELLGLQQSCQTLVSEYNAKATRADTVIFKHPERFLPGNWPGDRSPLPQQLDLTVCS